MATNEWHAIGRRFAAGLADIPSSWRLAAGGRIPVLRTDRTNPAAHATAISAAASGSSSCKGWCFRSAPPLRRPSADRSRLKHGPSWIGSSRRGATVTPPFGLEKYRGIQTGSPPWQSSQLIDLRTLPTHQHLPATRSKSWAFLRRPRKPGEWSTAYLILRYLEPLVAAPIRCAPA